MVAVGLRQVFAEGRYILLAAITGLAVFILATWLPNLGLVWQIAVYGKIFSVNGAQPYAAVKSIIELALKEK